MRKRTRKVTQLPQTQCIDAFASRWPFSGVFVVCIENEILEFSVQASSNMRLQQLSWELFQRRYSLFHIGKRIGEA